MATAAIKEFSQLGLGLFESCSQLSNDVVPFEAAETARAIRGVVLTSRCKLSLDHGRTLAASGIQEERNVLEQAGGREVISRCRCHSVSTSMVGRARKKGQLRRVQTRVFAREAGKPLPTGNHKPKQGNHMG